MKEEEQLKKKLEEASIEVDILKRMALEKEEMDRILLDEKCFEYANRIENSMPNKYFFDGEQEDPKSRLESYTEFRALLKLAIMPLSNLEPEVKEMAIKNAIPKNDVTKISMPLLWFINFLYSSCDTILRLTFEAIFSAFFTSL